MAFSSFREPERRQTNTLKLYLLVRTSASSPIIPGIFLSSLLPPNLASSESCPALPPPRAPSTALHGRHHFGNAPSSQGFHLATRLGPSVKVPFSGYPKSWHFALQPPHFPAFSSRQWGGGGVFSASSLSSWLADPASPRARSASLPLMSPLTDSLVATPRSAPTPISFSLLALSFPSRSSPSRPCPSSPSLPPAPSPAGTLPRKALLSPTHWASLLGLCRNRAAP